MRKVMVGVAVCMLWFACGCTSVQSGHVNEQNRQAGVVVQQHGLALQQSTDESAKLAGVDLVKIGGDIEANSKTLRQTTFPNYDLSNTKPYSSEASKLYRADAEKEAESGGILGWLVGKVGDRVPFVKTVVAFGLGLYAWWQRKRGTQTGKALDATMTGVGKYIAKDATAGEALKGIISNEHMKAEAMAVIQPRLDAIKEKLKL